MSRFVVTATWDDVPHLPQAVKDEILKNLSPHERQARSKGIPQLGSGAIYPIADEDIIVDDFPIPDHFPRGYGMDVGWNRTAGVWGAQDREAGVIYLYSEYYKGQAEPIIHANGFKLRGEWILGVIDPAARGRSVKDGSQLLADYRAEGLKLETAKNAVEAGILEVWQALSTGELKIFRSLANWFAEKRLYRRDEKGLIVKKNDHLMDATRYFWVSGRARMTTKPVPPKPRRVFGPATAWS